MPKVNINNYVTEEEEEYNSIRNKRKKHNFKEDNFDNSKKRYDKSRRSSNNK